MPLFDVHTLTGSWPTGEADLSLDALAQSMKSRQIDSALVTHTGALFYDSASGNAECRQICTDQPALRPVAVINPLGFPGCLEEIKRAADAGVTAFRLAPREHNYAFSASTGPLTAVLKRLESARLLLVDLTGLPQPVIHADIIEHLETPTAFTIQGSSLGILLHAAAMSPHVYIETSRLTAGGAIEAAVRRVGSERVLWGSGSPLYSAGSAVMSLQYAELNESERTAIFSGNARKLLGV